MSGAAAGATAAAAAAVANAIRASGVLVHLEPREWSRFLATVTTPLVIHAPSGFLRPHAYLFATRGLAFYTKTPVPLELPAGVEVIEAARIWVPS